MSRDAWGRCSCSAKHPVSWGRGRAEWCRGSAYHKSKPSPLQSFGKRIVYCVRQFSTQKHLFAAKRTPSGASRLPTNELNR